MYTEVSNAFKEAVKSRAITAVAKIYFPSLDLWIKPNREENVNSSLVDVTIKDNCCDNGKLFGTAVTKEVEITIINKDNLDLADQEFELYIGVKLENGTYEYVPYGNFIITSYEDKKSSNMFNIIAYDYMSKLNKSFSDITDFTPTYPITLKNFKTALYNALNINYNTRDLPNDNFMILSAPDFSGYSVRAVLGYIAELQGCFAKFNRSNTLQFYGVNTTAEQIDAQSMNSSLEIDKTYGPINVVSFTTQGVEGENVTLRDEDSIAIYGENIIEFPNNPFVYSQYLREQAIEDLFDALKGFTYVPTKFNYKARMYFDCGDTMQVYNVQNEEYVNSIVLNQTIKIPATRQSSMDNKALTKTQIANQYISQSEQVGKHTELMVDKANQQITSVISQIGDRSQLSTTITQDINGINITAQQASTDANAASNRVAQLSLDVAELRSEIGDVTDITVIEKGTGTLSFTDINESEPITILIRPIINDIDYLYPRNNLYPSDTLIPRTRTLRFENTKTGDIIDYELPADLRYFSSTVYDELNLSYGTTGETGTCVLTKKVGRNADGTNYALDEPEIISFEYPTIALTTGDYDVYIINNPTAYMEVRLMSQNMYTSQFATRAEVNSSIAQSALEIKTDIQGQYYTRDEATVLESTVTQNQTEIRSEVTNRTAAVSNAISTSENYTDTQLQNYSTTSQTQSLIDQKADDILIQVDGTYDTKSHVASIEAGLGEEIDGKISKVSNKTEANSIVSYINAASDNITLAANNKIVLNSAGKLIINSGNFQLDNNGNITATNGNFTGSVKVGNKNVVDSRGLYTHLNFQTPLQYEGFYAGLSYSSGSIVKRQRPLILDFYIPSGFTIVKANITFIDAQVPWRYTLNTSGGIGSITGGCNNMAFYLDPTITHGQAYSGTGYEAEMFDWNDGAGALSLLNVSNTGTQIISAANYSHNNMTSTQISTNIANKLSTGAHRIMAYCTADPTTNLACAQNTGLGKISLDIYGFSPNVAE